MIVYHFFAHYRAAILKQLLTHSEHLYFLAASPKSITPSIKPWRIPEPLLNRFIPLPCVKPHKRLLLQPGLSLLALQSDVDTMIFLGNVEWPCTWISALAARLTGKRVLFWTHGWKRRDTGIKRLLRNTFYRLAHGLLLYGHHAKIIGIENGFDPAKLYVIYNSLDYEAQSRVRTEVADEEINKIREELFDNPQHPLVVCTSRLIPGRRFDQLFEALAILKKQSRDVNLLLVGDGPEKHALQEIASREGLAVNFYGACYDERRLAELVMAANVTVAPGDIGLTAMHSLAFGTPVITHDDADHQNPEWEAIIAGRTGDFFRRGDVPGLAQVIGRWTRSALPDPAIRAECHKAIERFYTPRFQQQAIDRAVRGEPADDLFWMKDGQAYPDRCSA